MTCDFSDNCKEFPFRRVLVAGLGISGRGAVEVLHKIGASPISVDENKPEADLHDFNVIDWSDIDAVVTSPVFNPRTKFLLDAKKHNIPVMSEVDLAWRIRVKSQKTNSPALWVGITGTNGKTSTTEMTSSMLSACGFDAPAVGNIGHSLSHAALDKSHDVLCVELSSFQLHFTNCLNLDCAAITNIAADHLDWHGSIQAYAADKSKVFNGVKKVLVYNAQDSRVCALAKCAKVESGCKRVGFTLEAPKDGEIGVENGWIVDKSGISGAKYGEPKNIVLIKDLKHLCEPDGTVYPHLLADALTALALTFGVTDNVSKAVQALCDFAPGGHRIQTVASFKPSNLRAEDSIRFVDDSKATNAHAASASISSFSKKSVIWIAGGLAKGSHFEDLVASSKEIIKAVVVIGTDQRPIIEALRKSDSNIPVTIIAPDASYSHSYKNVDDSLVNEIENENIISPDSSLGQEVMHKAVEAAGNYAEPGDVVLMAPACASMDQFVSYADRGNRFAQEAQRWVQNHVK